MNIHREKLRALGHHQLRDPVTITAVMIGAAVGAVSAAVQGGSILKGALMGGLMGGVGSALSGAFGAASGAAGSGAAAAGVGELGAAAATGATEAGMAAVAGGADAALAASAGALESGVASGMAEAGTGMLATTPGPAMVGTGMETVSPGFEAAGNAGLGGPSFSTGFSDGGTAGGALDSGMAASTQAAGATGIQPQAGGGSFLDQLLNKGKGMLSSPQMGPAVVNTAGKMIAGSAEARLAQQRQDQMLAARRAETLDNRANSRFGNNGSRYGGMLYASPTTYKA